MRYMIAFAGAAFTSLTAMSAYAQSTEATSTRTFTPGDFEQYAPQTARDMVERIDGFRINNGDNDSRGFGEASQNVLINGQRITSKSLRPREALRRIPAANVERIELLDGASLDIPGLSGQVVNVIARNAGISGTWRYRARWREDLKPIYDGIELSVAGENGGLAWTLGFESDPGRGANSGDIRITNGFGEPLEIREEAFTFLGTNVETSIGLAWTPDNGHVANLNAEYSLFEGNEREASNVLSAGDGPIVERLFEFAEDEWASEVSGDYELGFGPGQLKFIGLQRNEHSPTVSRINANALDGSDRRRAVFDQTVDESETILRTEYNLATSQDTDWQFSLEGALNTLESESSLSELDDMGVFGPVDLGDPNIRVEERRAEAFVTYGRKILSQVDLRVSLGTEVSELESDGTNAQIRTFVRPKGSITATWKHDEKTTFTTKIERSVGQLNFFDFVSSVDVDQGDDNSGNTEIVPEQTWRFEFETERDFGNWGASSLTLFAEDLEDIVDRVPIGSGEGPGNLDSGQRYGIETEGTFNFDPLGWKNAELTYSLELQTSEVDDPVTGTSRSINGDLESYVEIELRHDVPGTDWVWGAGYEMSQEAPRFRLDAIRDFENKPGFMYAYIEHKDIFGMTGNIVFGNLLNQNDSSRRTNFTPDRTGSIESIEIGDRFFGPILTVNLSGTF